MLVQCSVDVLSVVIVPCWLPELILFPSRLLIVDAYSRTAL